VWGLTRPNSQVYEGRICRCSTLKSDVCKMTHDDDDFIFGCEQLLFRTSLIVCFLLIKTTTFRKLVLFPPSGG
jgi:hypothetical protein